MTKTYFDFHVHPLIKPFGHACKHLLKYYDRLRPEYFNYEWLAVHHPDILKNFFNAGSKTSLWNDKRPNRFFNRLFGELAFAKYSQSNLTAAESGDCRVIAISLYPIEKEFLTKSFDQNFFKVPFFKNLVTRISVARIKYIQSDEYRYFEDTEAQYEYLKSSATPPVKGEKRLVLAGSYAEIERSLEELPEAIVAFLSIEGANVFYPSKDILKSDIENVLENIRKVKNWEHPPLMISPAHHFYNGFVSHEKSLVQMVKWLGNIDQSKGCNTKLSDIPGFNYYTEEGLRIIDLLLDDTAGRRILIDLKHTDFRGRNEYYHHISSRYNNQVPVVFSHAAVGAPVPQKWFNSWTLNLNDEDIDAVWKTNGLIGLEFDQRILGFKEYIRYCRENKFRVRRTSPLFNAALVWNSARYIAERNAVLTDNNPEDERLNAWSSICVGSDFDGLINPINGYPTLRYLRRLKEALMIYADRFLKEPPCLLHKYSPQKSEPLVDAIMRANGMLFLKNNFLSAGKRSVENSRIASF